VRGNQADPKCTSNWNEGGRRGDMGKRERGWKIHNIYGTKKGGRFTENEGALGGKMERYTEGDYPLQLLLEKLAGEEKDYARKKIVQGRRNGGFLNKN